MSLSKVAEFHADSQSSTDDGAVFSVLVVDDDETNRIVLESMLSREGHKVYLAKDGGEAVSLYEKFRPDMVLMDVMMPVMDGYEATRRIKAMAGSHFVPITFLTALTDEASLIKCLDVGGDDFIVKPVSRAILNAKLYAVARVQGLYADLRRQQQELGMHHERLSHEHEIAEKIFAKVIGDIGSKAENIRSEIQPLAIANGDLLLTAQSADGIQYVMLGDYTGHGLAAAIGAIPAANIFYGMTRKGLGIREIVNEINSKLHAVLPTGQFLAACVLEWNARSGEVKLWNGGLPDLILAAGRGRGVTRLSSRNMPFGIMGGVEFNAHIDVRRVDDGDRIILYTDGLSDARNGDGQLFGDERLQEIIQKNIDPARLFDEITGAVTAFRGGHPQDDDMAVVEVQCDGNLLNRDVYTAPKPRHSSVYELSIRLDSCALSEFDPVRLVECIINGISALDSHRAYLYTVIAELYANALEHGVLAMDCSVKESVEGFSRYYQQREQLLAELSEGWVHIYIECLGGDSSGELVLQIEDSGQGFDPSTVSRNLNVDVDAKNSGRGIALARSLCRSMDYNSRGNSVRAVYAW